MSEKYLEYTVDELFQKYPIDKIIKIQKDIQYEIDKKRQELRNMVGERYRDVIEASDTIKLMEESASNLLLGINRIIESCQDLNRLRENLDITDDTIHKSDKTNINIEKKSVSMQIKILIYIPEQIWAAIDDADFLKATQLYLFSRHIYTGLRLDSKTFKNYPIIKTQWMKIEHFQKRINLHLHNELQKNNLSADIAADYLVSFVLLENISVTDLLHQFVEFRKLVLENELKSEVSSNNTVKYSTCSALKLIINTIQLIYLCFVDSGTGNGLVYEKLNNIINKEAEPTLSLVKLMRDPLMKYLPKIICDFRPVLKHSVDSVSSEIIGEDIEKWLSWVKQSINLDLSQRLNMVTSIKGLDNIREEALKIELVDNWELLCRKLSLPHNFNVWFLIFQPLLTERVCKLIEIKWNHIIDETERDISETLSKVSSGKTAKSELDLRWFTWKEEKSDVPSKFHLDGENKFVAKGLLMKCKAYSPNIVKLCEDFDSRLSLLLNDLELYLFGKDLYSERAIVRADIILKKLNTAKNSYEKLSDKSEIQEHLQKISKYQMERLIVKILSYSENKSLSTNEQMSYNLMIARFLLALQQLCPNLIKCFKIDGRMNQWNTVCSYLQQKQLEAWERWLKVMNNRLLQLTENVLSDCLNCDIQNILGILPQWTIVEIEEQNEDTTLKSQIRVPSQPNFLLQNLLFQICSKLNTVIPHTLPKRIHLSLINDIMTNILNIYEKIGQNDELIQLQALQYLFDIKYINLMFILRENKLLSSKAQDICEIFRAKIDPFDYDVFYTHLQNGVIMAAQKTQCLLGILIPKPEQLATVLGVKQSNSSLNQVITSEKDAMILAISDQGNLWFPLLPVTAPVMSRTKTTGTVLPVNATKMAEKKKVVNVSPKHKNIESSSALVRSGAASFLSDWFG